MQPATKSEAATPILARFIQAEKFEQVGWVVSFKEGVDDGLPFIFNGEMVVRTTFEAEVIVLWRDIIDTMHPALKDADQYRTADFLRSAVIYQVEGKNLLVKDLDIRGFGVSRIFLNKASFYYEGVTGFRTLPKGAPV